MIVALDPGPTPGFATYDALTKEFRAWIEPDWYAGAEQVRQLFGPLPPAAFVVERFNIGGSRKKSSNETIELIGVARYLAWDYEVAFVEQSPADAKQFSTPAKLKALAWDIPRTGGDHALSASRHLLLYLARNHVIDVTQLL